MNFLEGCRLRKCPHLPQSVSLKFKKLGNIINYGPNSHFQSKPIFRIILKYPLIYPLKVTLMSLNLGGKGQLGMKGPEVPEIVLLQISFKNSLLLPLKKEITSVVSAILNFSECPSSLLHTQNNSLQLCLYDCFHLYVKMFYSLNLYVQVTGSVWQ